MKPGKIVIRKYGNRRLYDTSASRYVNLEEVAEMIRRGSEVQVLDAKTGEDLTRVTLTQIIVEDTKGRPAGLPLELLRQLIVASDQARQDFLMWYLKTAFDTYHNLQSAVQTQLSGVRSAALAPIETMRRLFSERPENAETAELRRRIAELEEKLAQQTKPRKDAGKSKPRRAR